MQFRVQKKDLIEIVKTYQEASYAEHYNLLRKDGDSLDWLLNALATDPKNGISASPASI